MFISVDNPSELTDAQLDAAIAHEWETMRDDYADTDEGVNGITLRDVSTLWGYVETPHVDMALSTLGEIIDRAKELRRMNYNLRPLLQEREERQLRRRLIEAAVAGDVSAESALQDRARYCGNAVDTAAWDEFVARAGVTDDE